MSTGADPLFRVIQIGSGGFFDGLGLRGVVISSFEPVCHPVLTGGEKIVLFPAEDANGLNIELSGWKNPFVNLGEEIKGSPNFGFVFLAVK
jgi:hypothetical protein